MVASALIYSAELSGLNPWSLEGIFRDLIWSRGKPRICLRVLQLPRGRGGEFGGAAPLELLPGSLSYNKWGAGRGVTIPLAITHKLGGKISRQ